MPSKDYPTTSTTQVASVKPEENQVTEVQTCQVVKKKKKKEITE